MEPVNNVNSDWWAMMAIFAAFGPIILIMLVWLGHVIWQEIKCQNLKIKEAEDDYNYRKANRRALRIYRRQS